jgi:hypothetical protein
MSQSSRHNPVRPIDRALTRLRERQALVALIERDAIAAVSTNTSDALRLALLASELRASTGDVTP